MAKVGILGTGSWALALSQVLTSNSHSIIMWGRDSHQIDSMKKYSKNPKYFKDYELLGDMKFTSNIDEALNDVDFVLNVIPTQAIRKTLMNCEIRRKDTIIINASKGLEVGTLKRISEIFKDVFPNNEYAIISGPSHAEEVIKKIPTTLVAVSENVEIAQKIQDLFMNDFLRVYFSHDVIGVETSGALKNIIAICAGVCDGIGYGDNTIAAIITRGIVEIRRLGNAMGADPNTFYGLTGIGDLIVTCTSPHSRNRRFGKLLGQGKSVEEAKEIVNMTVEGVATTIAVNDISKQYKIEMPIQNALYRVLKEEISAEEATAELMGRQRKHENEVLL